MLLCLFRLSILAFETGERHIQRFVPEDTSGSIGASIPISVCHMGVAEVLRMARARTKQSIMSMHSAIRICVEPLTPSCSAEPCLFADTVECDCHVASSV
jgi:hypothetical protein